MARTDERKRNGLNGLRMERTGGCFEYSFALQCFVFGVNSTFGLTPGLVVFEMIGSQFFYYFVTLITSTH